MVLRQLYCLKVTTARKIFPSLFFRTSAVKIRSSEPDLWVFLAGKTGGAGERGVQPETRRALESIQEALERFGSSMDRVLKCTVFLVDMAEWGAMNEVYAEFFPDNKPARTAVGIHLSGDTRVEIECLAAA